MNWLPILKDRRIKTAYLANSSTFYMTGLMMKSSPTILRLSLLYPYVDDPNENHATSVEYTGMGGGLKTKTKLRLPLT